MKTQVNFVVMGAVVVVLWMGLFNSAQLAAQTACPDPNDPNVGYVSQNPSECARIRFTCAGGQAPFSNQCGCGCIGERTDCPDPNDPGVSYVSQDPAVCARVLFRCDADATLFSNHCGCGCLQTIKDTKCVAPPGGICTEDINECGHASACQCPSGYSYEAAVGQCLLNIAGATSESDTGQAMKKGRKSRSKCVVPPTGVCTKDLNQCGNASVCQCSKGFQYSPALGACVKDIP